MPGWDEASVDELLADPIVRDLMAADGVDPGKLRTLLYEVQRTIRVLRHKSGWTHLAGRLCAALRLDAKIRAKIGAKRGSRPANDTSSQSRPMRRSEHPNSSSGPSEIVDNAARICVLRIIRCPPRS